MRMMIWHLEGEGPPVDVPDTGIGPLCETVLLCVLLGVQRAPPGRLEQPTKRGGRGRCRERPPLRLTPASVPQVQP